MIGRARAFRARLLATVRAPGRLPHAARAAVCIGLPLTIGVLAGDAAAGTSASLGAFVAFSARPEPYRRRARLLGVLAVAFPLAVVLGSLAAPSGVASALVPAVFAAVACFLALAFALPPPREFLLVMVCLLATGLPLVEGGALADRGLLALAGAAFAWCVSMAGWLRPALRERPQRIALAAALDAAAALLCAEPGERDDRRHASMLALRDARAAAAGSGRAAEWIAPQLAALQDVAAAAVGFANVGLVADPASAARVRAAAAELRGDAPAPSTLTSPPPPGEAGGDAAPLSSTPGAAARQRLLVATATAHQARLDAAIERLEDPAPPPLRADELPRAQTARERLSAALAPHSLALPTAARIGLAVAAGAGLGHALGLAHAYWAALTAAAILQGATGPLMRRRARERTVGTFAGGAIAAALLAVAPPAGALVAAIVLSQLVVELLIPLSYALATVFITPIPLLMSELAGGNEGASLAGTRVIDTLIGVVIGVAIATLVWPRAATRRLPAVTASAFDSSRACLLALADPSRSRAATDRERARAQADLLTLRAVLDASLGELLTRAPERELDVPQSVERLAYLVTGAAHGAHVVVDPGERAQLEHALGELRAGVTGRPHARVALPPLAALPRTRTELERLAELTAAAPARG